MVRNRKMKHFTTHLIFRIVFLYLLFGGLWIAISDHLLGMLVTNSHDLTTLQRYKGWFFVVASAGLLFAVMRSEFRTRIAAEAALRESEEKYRFLMHNANDGIVIANAESGEILEVNRKIEELTGVKADRLIGGHITELHSSGNKERCRKLFQEVIDKKSSLIDSICILHRDNNGNDRDIPVEINANLVEISGKKIIQAIFRDITLRSTAEAARRKEKERAEQYLDVAGVILRVLDQNGAVTLINRKGSEILGYGEEEIVGKNWFEHFIPVRLRKEVREVFARLMAGQAVEYYENPVTTRSGEERTIAWHNTLIKDEQGRIIATLSSGEDVTARKRAEEQARYRLEHLTTLHAIDLIISSNLDLRVTLQEILDLVITQLHVDAADVLLLSPHTQMLEFAAMQGFRDTRVQHSRLRLGEGLAGRAALELRSIRVPDLTAPDSGYVRAPLLEQEGFVAYAVVPLVAKGQVKGVLEVFNRIAMVFDEEWIGFLEALAAQAAIAIDNATLFKDLQRSNAELILAYDTTIEGWARALELRDQETEGHTQRATEMTLRIAGLMGISETELVHIRRGSLLHDIGKMSIPDSILLKTGPLTDEEWTIMRRHPVYAFELLSPIAYLKPALDIPYCHHERWDGTGYPRGLKGEQIPLAARIFALADTWDALYSDRRYHAAWSEEKVREFIRSQAGVQFDPKVVELFFRMEQALKEGAVS